MKRISEADMINTHMYEWDILEYVGDHKLKCRCSCGKIKIVSKYDILDGRSTNCGHTRRKDLTGQHIDEWDVIKYIGNNKYLCKCSCGEYREVFTQSLREHRSRSCGHERRLSDTDIQSIVNTHINEWHILEYLGDYKYKCQCSCGSINTVSRYALLYGWSKSCGHGYNKLKNLKDKRFRELTAREYLGQGKWLCECSCGKMVVKTGKGLRNGQSSSCGHTTIDAIQRLSKIVRTQEQKEAVLSKDNLLKFIEKMGKTPSFLELSEALGLVYSSTVRLVNNYNLESSIEKMSQSSYIEDEIYNYIKKLTPNEKILRHSRNLLNNSTKEIDIYIPNKRIGIEFNGNYWHSDLKVDKQYHQNKTLECAKNTIRLIHIFEYEWLDDEVKQKIQNLLASVLVGTEKIYARNTTVDFIEDSDAQKFCELYHLQGYTKSSIRIGLKYDNDVIAVMTFGCPRFTKDTQYELLRLCWKPGISVVGGTEKLFKFFIEKFKPTSIITYTDISKFTGNIYPKLGFNIECFTPPNYKWVHPGKLSDVLTRYQTQKSKLVAKGLGTEDQTENEIMENLGYLKIYDSGNLKFIWNANTQ